MKALTFKGIFVALKNKKELVYSYNGYTLNMCFRDDCFKLYAYFFEGGDVMDEDNYKEEHRFESANFNEFKQMLSERYPGLAKI